MLALDNLSKSYKSAERRVDAVSELNFDLERGRFLAITGRSGSGKSTLLGMIGGISRPSSGSVVINGVDQWSLDGNNHADFRNQKIGFVFQFASLLPALRAIDNVALPAIIGGVLGKHEAYARARALLERVGLSARINAFPGEMSGGEQRRVAIARALINSPDLLLADEPTADLDEETETEILNLLIEMHRAFKLTLVVVTHNPAIAAHADRVIQMKAGHASTTEQRSSQRAEALPVHNEAAVRSIFEIPSEAAACEQVRLGEGIERLIGKFVMWAVPLVIVAAALNAGLENYQDSILEAKANARIALEDLAMKDLRAEVQDVAMGPGKTYLLNIYLRNTTGDKSIYVMSPSVRAFVQVGSSWQEVPLKAVETSASSQVRKITGKQLYQYSFEPDVPNYAQLFPYYMHVRFSNDMLVSPSSQPKDDLIERNDNYYVYLKPHDANDKAIISKMKFPGAPPVWIPMPPH